MSLQGIVLDRSTLADWVGRARRSAYSLPKQSQIQIVNANTSKLYRVFLNHSMSSLGKLS
jgi:hypothetical protein